MTPGQGAGGSVGEGNKIEDLRKSIEDTAAEEILKPGEPSSIEIDSLTNIISHLISFPYDKTSELTHFEHYKLSEREKEINAILAEIIILNYLPKIDMGKFALWCFIIFNGMLIAEKVIVHRISTKQENGKVEKIEKAEK